MLNNIFQELDHKVNRINGFSLKQKDISESLGITAETYRGYLNGTTSPIGLRVFLDLISVLPDEEAISVIREYKSNFKESILTNKILKVVLNCESYYDQILEYEQNKHMTITGNKKGVVYTHRKTAREMVEILDPSMDETLWEPSCGAGVFLIAVLEYIEKKYNPSDSEMYQYINTKLFFSDIDEDALEYSKAIVKQFAIDRYEIEVETNGKNMDGLLNTTHYDLILGNPPYIRIKNLEEDTLIFLRNNFDYCKKGNIDIYYAFIEVANKYAHRACMITPNSFIVNSSTKELREGIAPFITYLRDHRELKQFDTASTYTAIFMLNKKAGKEFDYAECDQDPIKLDRAKLKESIWKLSAEHALYDYEDRTTKFANIADVYSGIATLSDKSYIVYINTLTEDGRFYIKEYEGKKYRIESGLCISLLKLSKYFGETGVDDKKIIFPYNGLNTIMSEDEIQDNFPYAYNYLCDIRENVLDQRDKGKVEDYDNWFAYGRRQGFNIDFKEKTCFVLPLVYAEDDFIFKQIVPKERFIHSSGFVVVAKPGKENEVQKIMELEDFHIFLNLNGKAMPGKDVNYNRLTSTIIKKYPYKEESSYPDRIMDIFEEKNPRKLGVLMRELTAEHWNIIFQMEDVPKHVEDHIKLYCKKSSDESFLKRIEMLIDMDEGNNKSFENAKVAIKKNSKIKNKVA